MPLRLTALQRQELAVISRLTKICADDAKARRRAEREAARAAKAAALAAAPPKRPRHIARALGHYRALYARLAEAQRAMTADPKLNALTARVCLNVHTSTFAAHIGYHAATLAEDICPELIAWAAEYTRHDRRGPCPLPDLTQT